MLSSNILDIAITLGFTFLLLALIVSTVTEIFNTIMQRRSVYLQQGLKALFGNISKKKNGKTPFETVIDSPFIKLLDSEPGWTVKVLAFLRLFKIEDARFPAYISSNSLSLAVIDVLGLKNLTTMDYANVKKQIIKRLGPSDEQPADDNEVIIEIEDEDEDEKKKLKTDSNKKENEVQIKDLLLTILDNSLDKGGKLILTNFTAGIEKTFNDSMDRVTGTYKKKSQWISFIVSIIVVLIINVDTIKIVKTLQTDKDLLQNAVTVATNSYKQFDPSTFSGDSTIDQTFNDEAESFEVVSQNPSGTNPDTIIAFQKSKNNIKVIMNKLNESKIPMGWESTVPGWNEFWNAFGISIFGWLISILAIYLGAPFWFDVLNKVSNLRGAGKPVATKSSDVEVEVKK